MNGRKLYRKGPDRWSQKRDSRIKNGIELREAEQKRVKKRRKEQEKWREGIDYECRGVRGKTRLVAWERRLGGRSLFSLLRRKGWGRILAVSR